MRQPEVPMPQDQDRTQKTKPDSSRVSGIAAAAIGGAIESDENPPHVASPAPSAQPGKPVEREAAPSSRSGATGETVQMAEVHLDDDVEDDTDQSWRRAGGATTPARQE